MSDKLHPTEHLRQADSAARTIETGIDPIVCLVWLFSFGMHLHVEVDAFIVLSVVLTFALTYPGRVRFVDTLPVLAFKCCVTAVGLTAGLVLLALASGRVESLLQPPNEPWFWTLPIVLLLAQLAARATVPRLIQRFGARATAIVCGANTTGLALAEQFNANPFHGVTLLGFFDDREPVRMPELLPAPLLGSFDDLGDYARRNAVDRVYMALPMASQPRILRILDDLKDTTCSIYFAPDLFITEIINGRFASVGGMPVVAVRDSPFASVLNSASKRLEDIVLSSIALILLSPIMLAVAIAIRLDTPGKAIFRQKRYGLDGREIMVYKFRSMRVTEDGAQTFTAATRGDSRITRLGAILRKTSLDELPQLINVLQGRMSLVGPRPHAVAMNEQFRKLIPGYMLRHKIKPGITGLAQVRGFRGGDDLPEMSQRISSDIEYLRKWSLRLDLAILFRTVIVVLFDQKAY